MLKTFLAALVGSKMEARSGHPLAGAIAASAIAALAKRSVLLAVVAAAVGVAAIELVARNSAGPARLHPPVKA